MTRPIRDLLSRGKARWAPVEGRDDLVGVPEDEVEEMVNLLAIEAYEYAQKAEVPEGAVRALSTGFLMATGREPATDETLVTAQWAARIGYMARAVEWQRGASTQAPRNSMAAGLRETVESNVAEELAEGGEAERSFHDVLGELTAFFVRREPLDVPYDAEQGFALMWTIPGMGGEVRALVRDRTLRMLLQRDGEGLRSAAGPIVGATGEDFQRTWKYGFVLRSFEEFFWEE